MFSPIKCNFSLSEPEHASPLLLLRSCHLCQFESRNHYSNDGPSPSLPPSPLARSNALLLLNPNSELFSPAGIKKRHRGIARGARGRTDQIKFHPRPAADRPRGQPFTVESREFRGIFVNLGSIRKDAPRQISSTRPGPRYPLIPRKFTGSHMSQSARIVPFESVSLERTPSRQSC